MTNQQTQEQQIDPKLVVVTQQKTQEQVHLQTQKQVQPEKVLVTHQQTQEQQIHPKMVVHRQEVRQRL